MIQYSINSQDTQIDVYYDIYAANMTKSYDNKLLFVKNSSQNIDIYKIETTGITKVQTLTGGVNYVPWYFRDPITSKEYLVISQNESKIYLLTPTSATPAVHYCDCTFAFIKTIYNNLVIGAGDVNNPLGNMQTFSVFDLISKTLKTTANSLPSPYNTAHTAGNLRYNIIPNSDLIILIAFDSNSNITNIGIAKINRTTFTATILYSNNDLLTNKSYDCSGTLVENKLYVTMNNSKLIRFNYNGTTIVKDLIFAEKVDSGFIHYYGNEGVFVIVQQTSTGSHYGVIYNNSTTAILIQNSNTAIVDANKGILYDIINRKMYNNLNNSNFAIVEDNTEISKIRFLIYLDDNNIFTMNSFNPVYLTSYTASELTYNLTVNTTPADASFYIRVGAALSLQDKSKPIPLTPGEYYTNTIAKTDDYKDDVRTINITQDMTLDITLLRRPWVEFKVTPSDAVVMFNDAGTWVQGTKFRCLEGLTYEYTVSKTGFDTQIGTVVVGTQDIVRNITLVSNVRIDKEKRFPGTFKLLDITKPEYITEKGSVVIAGADKLVNIVLKAANVYKVTFTLTPINAVVELLSKGSILTGTSFDLTPGSYTYQIKCDGYISKSGSVTVIGEAKTITETLEEAIYQVSFTTTPAAAIVQVYYNNTWNSGKTHNLKKGSYQYRVTATDYTDKTGTIEVVNANVTTNVVLSSDGGVVTITNWTPTDAMSQMSPITEMFRLGKGLLPENNRLTYTLPKDKYQLKITSNQPQKYLPYYNKFDLTGDKTINPVFRENAIDWSTIPNIDVDFGYYTPTITKNNLENKVLINSQQIIFPSHPFARFVKSGTKYIYQQITNDMLVDPSSQYSDMITSAGNEVFAVICQNTFINQRTIYINKAISNNIYHIGKLENDCIPRYITDNGQYITSLKLSTRKLFVTSVEPFNTRPAITLPISSEVQSIRTKCSEDGNIVVVSGYTSSDNNIDILLIYKYNNGSYTQITLPNTVKGTLLNSIGLINSTHIGLVSSEAAYDDKQYYDIYKINDDNTLTRLISDNSISTINGVAQFRTYDISFVLSTPFGLICYKNPFLSSSSFYDYEYIIIRLTQNGYKSVSATYRYSVDYPAIIVNTFNIPKYNGMKQAVYMAINSSLLSNAATHPVINSPILINKILETENGNGVQIEVLSNQLHGDLKPRENIMAISTDGNLILTNELTYRSFKKLKLYDLTNNSVSEYIP